MSPKPCILGAGPSLPLHPKRANSGSCRWKNLSMHQAQKRIWQIHTADLWCHNLGGWWWVGAKSMFLSAPAREHGRPHPVQPLRPGSLSPGSRSRSPRAAATFPREQPGRAPPRHAHGDLTSLAPHERLPEILVVPREKTPTGAAARENSQDALPLATRMEA